MSTSPDARYDEFIEHVERYFHLGDAGEYLGWDQQVMMPPGGTPARAKQQSVLSSLQHDLLTAEALADHLDALADASLDPGQEAVLREVRRKHERAARVPRDLVETISETSSNALPVWEEAKETASFDTFEDHLRELLDLRREYAAAIDPDRDPYAVLVEEYEPYLDLETIDSVLAELGEALPPLIDAIADSDVTLADPFGGSYDESAQEALVRAALDTLDYDWDRGRLDTAPHPFSMGTQFDARITTRFSPGDPLDALSSTIHEFGHATYTHGLPDEHYGTPLGDHRDLTVHESQSRLWENHVGRSRAFWRLFAPAVEEHLGVTADPETLYEAANRVHPENVIRVEADELTYHLHIVLRYEIERDLVRGDLEVEEVPAVWNEKMAEYLGVEPADDGEGCLQDIHWTHGSFGYFPTYSLGSVLAAQLFEAAETALGDTDDLVAAGEFDPLHDWLTGEIHRHGCRYTTPDLIREATGGDLSAAPFISSVEEKYGALYDL